MNELISVIIPIYKVEKYLKRCIDSVLQQTYKNLEVILVDDGSPDRCGEICDKYVVIDNRIKVIHKRNGGLSEARNAGIEISQGDYIAFIDSDDWIHKKHYEELYSLLKESNADISVCNFIKVSNEDIQVDTLQERIYEYSNIEALEQLVDKFYVQMVIACGKLYKKSLFKEIRFPVGRLHEDEFTTYKAIFNAEKVILTTKQLYYYWQREDSITGREFSLKGRLDAIDAIEERAKFFDSIGEIKLRNKTLKDIFYVYKSINDRISVFENRIDKKNFKKRILKLKQELRKTNQEIRFKVYYELYFIMPKVTNYIFKIYQCLR